MKTNIPLLIIISALILASVVFAFWGDRSEEKGPEKVQSQSSSVLSVDKKLYDFGEIDIFGGVVTTEFVLINEGPDDIVVTEGTTSCGCTNAQIGGIGFGMHQGMERDYVIPAGENRNLTVVYDPLAHGPNGIGLAQRSVFLKTNSSKTPDLEMRIKAMVVKSE